MIAHLLIIGVVILIILGLQIKTFLLNRQRIIDLNNAFSDETGNSRSFYVEKDEESGLVKGIGYYKSSNKILDRILSSINKYLNNNRANVIDFNILRDTVDRNCESIEEDIEKQTPIPLYLGLMGTMAGIIIGILSMWIKGAVDAFLEPGPAAASIAAEGLSALLSCVAFAMLASIVGLILTTYSSYYFKNCKLQIESHKNDFLTWMQSNLLPVLATDTNDVLVGITNNLVQFNRTFAQNTGNLRDAFESINVSYEEQRELLHQVQSMNLPQIIRVLGTNITQLSEFNQYLASVQGYTQQIEQFRLLFHQEESRLGILEDIHKFFQEELTQIEQRKVEINREISDVDEAIRQSFRNLSASIDANKADVQHSMSDINNAMINSLSELKISANNQIAEFKIALSKISEEFSSVLKQQQQTFLQMDSDFRTRLISQIEKTPDKLQHIETLSSSMLDKFESMIGKLDVLIQTTEKIGTNSASIDSLIEKMDVFINKMDKAVNRKDDYLPPGPTVVQSKQKPKGRWGKMRDWVNYKLGRKK